MRAKDSRTIDEGKMTNIAKKELEALPPKESPREEDCKLGKNGKRRRKSDNLTGTPNRQLPNFQNQSIMPWMRTTLIST
jgi:hypothetical protein